MRRELVWAALWLLAGIGLGLATGRPAAGKGVAAQWAGASPVLSGASPPASGASAPGSGGVPVTMPEISRFAGLWYDIAATPDRFHEGCNRDATTRYTLRPDAALQIENLCRGPGGDLRDAEGVLRAGRAGLELRYAPDWLAWLPLAWSDVRVIDVDPALGHVVMATPDRRHLWVLSRKPAMAAADYQGVLERARARGFAVDRLRPIPQEGADRAGDGGEGH